MDLDKFSLMNFIPEEIIKKHSYFLSFLILTDINFYFPLIKDSLKKQLLNKFLNHEESLFVSRMNLMGCEIDFTDEFTCKNYLRLLELKIDDYNLNQFLRHWENFINLTSLEIISSVGISFNFRNFSKLKKIKIINTGKNLVMNKQIMELDLDFLFLNGYIIEIEKFIPKKLHLEDCYVIGKKNLSGCEQMTLITVFWSGVMSYPSNELYLEDFEHTFENIPKTLKILHLHNSVFNINFSYFENLEDLRYTGCSSNNMFTSLPDNLKKITFDLSLSQTLNYPKTLEEIFFRGEKNILFSNITFPTNMKKLVLTNCNINLKKLFNSIIKNDSLSFLKISYSVLEKSENSIKIPPQIRDIIFDNCENKDIIFLEIKENQKIKSICTDNINLLNGDNLLKLQTNILSMDKNKFILFCETMSDDNLFFDDYNKYLSDLQQLSVYDSTYEKFLTIFHSFPYKINNLNFRDLIDFFSFANDNSRILISNVLYSKTYILDNLKTPPISEYITSIKKSRS